MKNFDESYIIEEGYYDPYEKPDPWKELLKDKPAEQQYPDLGTKITADGVWRNGVFTPYGKRKKEDNHIEK